MATRKLTVLQVLPALDSGGVEKGTLEIADALVADGHRSMVMSNGGRLVKQLTENGSEHIQWPIGEKSLKTLFLIKKLRKFLSDEKIDVVHVRSRLPAWIVYLAWKKMPEDSRPKFVTTVHGFYSVSRYSAVMTKGEVVIAVSGSVKQYIQENYPETDMTRVKVIHRGVDPQEYPFGFKPAPDWMEKWYSDYPQLNGKKIITLPGRITRLKGHEDFIDVMQQLSDNNDIMGVIAGGYEEKKKDYFEEIKALVKSRGLEDRIIFTGHRSDLREILSVSDVVLSLTQKPESFGRTTIEALSMGVPVCGYDHGGVGEQLEMLFSAGSVEKKAVSKCLQTIKKIMKTQQKPSENKAFLKQTMLLKTLNVYKDEAFYQ